MRVSKLSWVTEDANNLDKYGGAWFKDLICLIAEIRWRRRETQKAEKREREKESYKDITAMQNERKSPFYHPDSAAPPSLCSLWSPPSSAERCRSAGQWLARHSCPCTPRAHQSPASCCPRNLPPGRTCHRISASAWRGCQSPCSWRRLGLPRRSTCLNQAGELWGSSGCSCSDFLCAPHSLRLCCFRRRWSNSDKSAGINLQG